MQYNYKILLNKEDDSGYMVSVPALPGCIEQGNTIDDALAMAKGSIELYVEELQSKEVPIRHNSNTLEYSLNPETA